MSQNHFTLWQDNITPFIAANMNSPLGELDQAITNLQPIQIGLSYQKGKKPADLDEIDIPIAIPFTLPQNLTGSLYTASDIPTAQVIVTINKNGSAIGTMTVAGSGSTASFVMTSATSFIATDILKFIFPTQDATWAGISIQLLGSKNI